MNTLTVYLFPIKRIKSIPVHYYKNQFIEILTVFTIVYKFYEHLFGFNLLFIIIYICY
jgi:hypothetical protein